MLGIQNTLPASNPVKFKSERDFDNTSSEETTSRFDEEPGDTFDSQSLEDKKNNDLETVNKTKSSLDELADNLDSNPDRVSKHASKLVRAGSSIAGLVATFVGAKYGAKATIGLVKNIAHSKLVGQGVEGATKGLDFAKPTLKTISSKIASVFKPITENPNLKAKVEAFTSKPFVKKATGVVSGYAETVKAHVSGAKIQNVAENTLALSTTTAVAIDTAAGRNGDKSNLELALGN